SDFGEFDRWLAVSPRRYGQRQPQPPPVQSAMTRTVPPPARAASAGITLLELILTLAVGAVLLGAGIPALQALVLDSRRTADVTAVVPAVQVARSAAAQRGRPVVLCGSNGLATCADGYARGWLVFVDEAASHPPERSLDEPLLLAHRPSIEGTI